MQESNPPHAVYKTAVTPWSPPFLLNRTDNSVRTDDIQTAGYPSLDEVDYTIFDLSRISTLQGDINNIGIGTTIWTAVNYNQTWDVYRITDTGARVVNLANALDNRIQITTNGYHGLAIEDIVLLKNIDVYEGFYKVVQINSLESFTIVYGGSLVGFSSQAASDTPLYKLTSLRYDYASELADAMPTGGWTANSKAWVDYDSEQNTWAVYNKTDPWQPYTTLTVGNVVANGRFGSTVKFSDDNNFVTVGEPGFSSNSGALVNYILNQNNQLQEDITVTPQVKSSVNFGSSLDSAGSYIVAGAPGSSSKKGYVAVYTRNFQGQISLKQMLAANTSDAVEFGTSLSISDDNQWLYVGAPGKDKVYVYGFNSSINGYSETLTADGTSTGYNLTFSPASSEVLSITEPTTGNVYIPFLDFTANATAVNFVNPPPAGDILVIQRPSFYYVTTLTGNLNSRFGSSVATSTGGAQLVVGAPNDTISGMTDAGSISIYDRSIEKFIVHTNQTLFGGVRTPLSLSKVYLGNELQTLGVDYTIVAGNYIQFSSPIEAGNIVSIETDQFNLIKSFAASQPAKSAEFGYSVDLCANNCSVYVGEPYYNAPQKKLVGRVYRLLNQGKVYGSLMGTVQNPTVTIGNSIRINDFEVTFTNTTLTALINQINSSDIPGITAYNENGYLKLVSDSTIALNKLRVLPGVGSGLTDLGLDVFKQVEIIENPTDYPYDRFGMGVKIGDTSDVLLVSSTQATTIEETTFDGASTTFDADSIRFLDNIPSGAVWLMNYLGDSRSTADHPGKFAFVEQLTPKSLGVLDDYIQFGSAVDVNKYQLLIGCNFNSSLATKAGAVYMYNNPDRLKGWDIIRQETPKVDIDSLIKIYIYSIKDQIILSNLDYIDPAKGKILGLAEQDITYKTDYDPAIYNKSANLEYVTTSSTFHWNNSQVGQVWWDLSKVRYLDYEQGTIKYRTSHWGQEFPNSSIDVYEWVESLYPPSRYVSNGGDGVPKYDGNDYAYVELPYVDPITNTASVKYYFWVKNKTTVTANQFGRTIPTVTIADYIRNPKSSGITYLAAIQDDAVAVYNVVGKPVGKDVVLHIDYATQLNNNVIHSEYALFSEKDTKADQIPQNIYNKLVDSVSGLDVMGNSVPDPLIPPQSRYGIDIRPRQSMFIDRNKAVEEMVTYVNAIFKKNIISQGFDLTTLMSGEPVPPAGSVYYNITVPNYETLSYVDIVNKPVGYKVLVESNETIDYLWTIYTKQADNTWLLTRVQSYNTADYWEYIDWYAEGFDSSVKPTYTINSVSNLSQLALKPLDIVKVLNNGSGKWVLLQIFPNLVQTVGLQSGTIALKSSLYDFIATGVGFGNGNFDTTRFDQSPGIELRKILYALQNDIFINQLSQNFIDLFFVFIYYVLNEQKYIDWAIKTSFINVLHKLRGLTQPPIYHKDNQNYYRQYIEEVKPYHTTIREYVVDYQGVDNANGYVTDFDVVPYFDQYLNLYRSPSGEFVQDAQVLQGAEYKDWLSSYAYHVGSIIIVDAGSGYTLPPEVTITGSSIGNDAVAKAYVVNGKIARIDVIYPGTSYLSQPTVTISGGNGTGGKAYAQLANDTVRKIKTTLVYDRITYGSTVKIWIPNIINSSF